MRRGKLCEVRNENKECVTIEPFASDTDIWHVIFPSTYITGAAVGIRNGMPQHGKIALTTTTDMIAGCLQLAELLAEQSSVCKFALRAS